MHTLQKKEGEGIYDLQCVRQMSHDRLTNVSVMNNDPNVVLANDIKSNASMHLYDARPKLERLNFSLLKPPRMACLLQSSDYCTTSC